MAPITRRTSVELERKERSRKAKLLFLQKRGLLVGKAPLVSHGSEPKEESAQVAGPAKVGKGAKSSQMQKLHVGKAPPVSHGFEPKQESAQVADPTKGAKSSRKRRLRKDPTEGLMHTPEPRQSKPGSVPTLSPAKGHESSGKRKKLTEGMRTPESRQSEPSSISKVSPRKRNALPVSAQISDLIILFTLQIYGGQDSSLRGRGH
ncbi:uncharacterized protein LOC135716483 [Ochlerotatus camptorhynchus]|uniref:uncharacterized protein LOC135697549 n=1 Tax=Ochlerotatus camptorhynchus TaxID=644619 RepID=UPI0031D915F7